jgi:hypothetical protein
MACSRVFYFLIVVQFHKKQKNRHEGRNCFPINHLVFWLNRPKNLSRSWQQRENDELGRVACWVSDFVYEG